MARSTERRTARTLPHPFTTALRQLFAALVVAVLLAVLLIAGISMALRRSFAIDLGDLPDVALWVGLGVGGLVLVAASVGIARSTRLHLYLRRAARPPRNPAAPRQPVDRMTERLLTDIDHSDLGLRDLRFRMVAVDRGAFAVAYMTPEYHIDRTPTIAPLRLGDPARAALGTVGWLEPERRTIGSEGEWQYRGKEYTGIGADLADNPGIPLDAGKIAVLLTSGDESLAAPVRELVTRARALA
ncbi:MAG: hypothetical protein ACTHXO_05315 [Actinomycetaceae bacterium]